VRIERRTFLEHLATARFILILAGSGETLSLFCCLQLGACVVPTAGGSHVMTLDPTPECEQFAYGCPPVIRFDSRSMLFCSMRMNPVRGLSRSTITVTTSATTTGVITSDSHNFCFKVYPATKL
jgi:hypothetical protein